MTIVVWAAALAAAGPAAAATGGDLMTYGTGGTGDSGDVMAAGTNPALAPLSGGGYELAYQASDGTVELTGSQAVGRVAAAAPGSSGPAITGLTSGSYEVAYEGTDGALAVAGGAGSADSGITMDPTTSPFISPTPNAGYQAVVASSAHAVWGFGALVTGSLGLAVAPGSSPSIQGINGYMVAYEAPDTGFTATTETTPSDTHLGMEDPSTATIMPLTDGSWEASFVANTDQLWVYSSTSGPTDTGLALQPHTSPALTNLQSGGFEVAYHGVNGDLWTYGTAGSTDTGEPMAAGSSPAVAGLAPSGLEIAYQGPVPPSPPVVSAPSTAVTNPIPVRKPTITSLASGRVKGSHGRLLRTRVRFGWNWAHARTRLSSLNVTRLPRLATVTVRCAGRLCGHRRVHHAKRAHVARLIHALQGHVFRAGDRLFIRVSAPGYATLRAVVTIRDGRKPHIHVMTIRRHPTRRHHVRHRRHKGGTHHG
jgi:hypothetical protein